MRTISHLKSQIVLLLACVTLCAQAQDALSYRRNSLAMLLVYHPEDEFGKDIYAAFDSLPLPDKYDDLGGCYIMGDPSPVCAS